MDQNSFQTQYNVTKKSKIRDFYDKNKFIIFSSIIILVIIFVSANFYFLSKEKTKRLLADNYVEAKIYLRNGEENKAKKILKEIIIANDFTYSTLSLFLISNENLITDQDELITMYDHVLENNKFESELKNLIIFKKVLVQSISANESEIIKTLKPIINGESVWKPHALLLLGDYYVSKKQYLKAKEFYAKIMTLRGLNDDLYKQAKLKLIAISND
tara:strand:+ start:301 stop:948 length:648 start_codon:yes stop_codon:yes gene_type:complete